LVLQAASEHYGGVAWPPLERRMTWAIVVPVPTICVFSWLLGSIQRHQLVREAVNLRETKAGWPRSRQEFACVFLLGFVCFYHRPPPLSTYADLPTVLTIVHFDGTHPIPPQYRSRRAAGKVFIPLPNRVLLNGYSSFQRSYTIPSEIAGG
jgi:hypothetical protein